MLIKNVESKIKLSLFISIISVVGGVVIAIASMIFSSLAISDARKSIYVIDSDVPILVKRVDEDVNIGIEARSHIGLFHRFLFTLVPDDKEIEKTLKRAIYLSDESGLRQINNLRERGFYNEIQSSSSFFSINTDSIKFSPETMSFKYYGTQRIERKTAIVYRQLITEGKLIKTPRSENNPHGFLVTNYKTIFNKDISSKKKY